MSLPPVAPTLLIGNRQRAVSLDLVTVECGAGAAIRFCLQNSGGGHAVLAGLPAVEVALVSDRVIARIHRRFLAVPGATDVITFEHGELVVSAPTAARRAQELGEVVEREVLRYIVHGLLHLNGHKDAEVEDAARMWQAQEQIINQVWPTKSR